MDSTLSHQTAAVGLTHSEFLQELSKYPMRDVAAMEANSDIAGRQQQSKRRRTSDPEVSQPAQQPIATEEDSINDGADSAYTANDEDANAQDDTPLDGAESFAYVRFTVERQDSSQTSFLTKVRYTQSTSIEWLQNLVELKLGIPAQQVTVDGARGAKLANLGWNEKGIHDVLLRENQGTNPRSDKKPTSTEELATIFYSQYVPDDVAKAAAEKLCS